jgi:DNA-binding response OmpR family regulator
MSQPRALLVVDSPGLELFYRTALTTVGLEVLSARNGETALTLLRTPQPVIVALDLQVGGMGGVEFIRNLRVQRATAAPPVVVLPLQDNDLAAAATSAGAARVLTRDNPLRTLALLAHAQARIRGTPSNPITPSPADWLPCAGDHVYAIHEALHALTRDASDAAARNALGLELHGLAELLSLGGEEGLCELASAMEIFIMGLRSMGAEINRSAVQSFTQAIDFIAARLEEYSPGAVRPVQGAEILIVDDEPAVCQLVSAAAELAGLKPHIAASPSACIASLQNTTFDLVILDIGLPEMSGFDLCTHIRATGGHHSVPILFLTGMNTFQNRAKSALIGGNDFVTKPFHPLELGLKALLWVQQSRLGRV